MDLDYPDDSDDVSDSNDPDDLQDPHESNHSAYLDAGESDDPQVK